MHVMKKLTKRIQTLLLNKYLKKFPVVVILGARQVGKTTLVKKLLSGERKYFTFDDEEVVLTIRDNLNAFVSQKGNLIIDEVQKLYEIMPAIKMSIDEKRIKGKFILTGSANLLRLPKVRESLAGRAVYLEMDPLNIFECMGNIQSEPNIIKLLRTDNPEKAWQILNTSKPRTIPLEKMILRGGYPDARKEEDNDSRQIWFKNYVKTYLERDIRDIQHIHNLYEFRKFLSLAALRCGQILNKSNLSKDSGISYSTAGQFFNLLLSTFQIFLIEPYFRNIGKRLIKAPKLMWSDTGLAAHLQGLNSWQDVQRIGRAGFLLENKIAIEFKSLLSVYMPMAKLFYWRTSGGAEIDLLVEHKGKLFPIEVKWSGKIDRYDLNSMKVFLKDFKKEASWGMVLYRGKSILRAVDNIFLVPFDYLF